MMQDNIHDAAKSLIGEEAVRKLARARIVPQWKRDDVDRGNYNCELRAWSRAWKEAAKSERERGGMYKTSYMELLHAWQTRKRCETCRHCGSRVYEGGIYEQWCRIHLQRCAPNGFRDWEANDES